MIEHTNLVREQLITQLHGVNDKFRIANYIINIYTPLWLEQEKCGAPLSSVPMAMVLLYKYKYLFSTSLIGKILHIICKIVKTILRYLFIGVFIRGANNNSISRDKVSTILDEQYA